MHYECEADYNAAIAAQAEAEAEMQAQAEYQYQEYLESLIENKKFYLYALEICQDLLSSQTFKDSGLSALEYLTQEKARCITNTSKVSDMLPF